MGHTTAMRKLLFVWEQGANLGHLANLRLPMEVALSEGFEVVLAARVLDRVHEVLGDLPMTVVQAPFLQTGRSKSAGPIQSFPQMLWTQCFGTETELHALLVSWRALFAKIAPTLVLAEHSPTALLAAHGLSIRTLQIGTGFTVPPWPGFTDQPFAVFGSDEMSAVERERLVTHDVAMLNSINKTLTELSSPVLSHLSEIFPAPKYSFLLTWPELDHFGGREGVPYFGPAGPPPAQVPVWSRHPGPKLFVYLQNFPSLDALLRDLQASGANTLVYIKNLPEALRRKYQGSCMQFVDHLVDLHAVAREATCAITHGSHNTSSSLLAAGLPLLFIPLQQEQLMFGMRLVRQGCAAMAFQDQSSFQTAIRALLTNGGLYAHAKVVGHQLPAFDESRLRGALVEAFATSG